METIFTIFNQDPFCISWRKHGSSFPAGKNEKQSYHIAMFIEPHRVCSATQMYQHRWVRFAHAFLAYIAKPSDNCKTATANEVKADRTRFEFSRNSVEHRFNHWAKGKGKGMKGLPVPALEERRNAFLGSWSLVVSQLCMSWPFVFLCVWIWLA